MDQIVIDFFRLNLI